MKLSRQDMSEHDVPQSRTKPSSIRRRSGRQGSSRDRHGIVFESSNGSSIRAITPESANAAHYPPGNGGPVASPPQRAPRRAEPSTSKDPSTSVENTDEDNKIDNRRRRARTRAGTKEEPSSDASPGSFISKTRRRLNSITTSGNLLSKPEEQLGSIGFPSVVHPPPSQENLEDRYVPRTPRRTFTPESVSTFASGGFRSPTFLDTDSAKILHLMKTTCGRMHGILFFRQLHTNVWASGYCSIQVASGSLVCQVKGEVAQTKTLISDLRGCSVRTHYDSETQSTYLSVQVASTGTGFQLRPSVPETFDSWLAALLCWQPLRPRGIHNKMTKPQPVAITEKRPSGQRRISDLGAQKSKAIIKVGKLLLWDGPLPSGSQTSAYHVTGGLQKGGDEWLLWRSVSCTLHENGSFKLFSEGDNQPLSSIPLSQLARCAVQRLDQSILDMPHCIAIYPQYTIQASAMRLKRPVVLCFESRVVFEAWFVLLRALAVPELYGPEQPRPGSSRHDDELKSSKSLEMANMFRIERQLVVKITEAKLVRGLGEREVHESTKSKRKSTRPQPASPDVYADVVCDQDLRARTSIKPSSTSVFWADEFTLMDLPSNLNRIAVIVRAGNPGEQEWTMIAHGPYDMSGDAGYLSGLGGIEISSHDSVIGKVDIQMDELENESNIEKWWSIVDNNERVVGQMLMKITLQETVVLMSEEYEPLSTLLHSFANSLTTQIAQALGPELRQLSDVLLDYFQASGGAHDWLSNLIEEEIDGIYRETPPMRMRFSGRIQSTDSYESAEQRELLVRDLSRSATMEANLLFRGNSLITKALDAHMRRLGGEYLEAVLGARLRKICDRDFDCEVDPGRVKSPDQLDKSWSNLLHLTTSIWKRISTSAWECPAELRMLFRHIRSCAEDRYGSFIRTVKYTSVSGFLFLRFFCPAILNPKLFGLLPDHPPDRTKRSLTLIAKSLMTLANMAKFGTKETWMEPMNKFLTGATIEFKAFVDEICSISSSQMSSALVEPQYGAPNQIKGRLPPTSREGLPSLPFLLDSTRLLADLVELWATNAPKNISEAGGDQAVQGFDTLCRELHKRSQDCLSSAEQAEKPDTRLESKWQQVLKEQQRTRNVFEQQFMTPANNDPDLTALPQPADATYSEHHAEGVAEGDTPPSSGASGAGWDRRAPFPRAGDTRALTASSTNSSTASFEAVEESRPRPPPGSRDGKKNARLFQLMGSSGGRKGKGADREQAIGNDI